MANAAIVDIGSYVTPDGTTNNTTAIDAARAAAVSLGAVLMWRPGTYIYDGGAVASSERWVGIPGLVTIKRSTTTTTAYLVNVTASEFECFGVTCDGNKANNSAAVNLVQVNTTCTRSRIERCVFQNAKASGGFGDGLVIRSLVASSLRHEVIDCRATTNDSDGLVVQDARHLLIRGGAYHANGAHGISLDNFDTNLAQKVRDVVIEGPECYGNTGSGLSVGNFRQDNDSTAYDLGWNDPDVDHLTITGGVFRDNGAYGVSLEGETFTFSGGIVSGNADGILCNGSRGTISGAIVHDNAGFGIDAGFSQDVTITGGRITDNVTGVNFGSARGLITGVGFDGNTSRAIHVYPVESDSARRSTASADELDGVFITANMIRYPNGAAGVLIQDVSPTGRARVAVTGNHFFPEVHTEANARLAILRVSEPDHVTIADNHLITSWNKVLTMVSSTVFVPDVLDWALLDTTTTVGGVRYWGSGLVTSTGIGYIRVTAGGTGYLAASTTVTITGDGTGAEATALVYEPTGEVVGIRMDEYGTGYTSATVTIGGAGSGATASATIGLALPSHRKLALTCLQAQTFTRTGTPNIEDGSGADISVAAKGTLTMRSYGGKWYAK